MLCDFGKVKWWNASLLQCFWIDFPPFQQPFKQFPFVSWLHKSHYSGLMWQLVHLRTFIRLYSFVSIASSWSNAAPKWNSLENFLFVDAFRVLEGNCNLSKNTKQQPFLCKELLSQLQHDVQVSQLFPDCSGLDFLNCAQVGLETDTKHYHFKIKA